MRGYGAYLSAQFRTLLQYRAAALAGFATQLAWGLILAMIYEAFYGSSDAPQPISLAQVITYIWLGQAFLGLLPWNVDRDLQSLIRSGGVAYELVRPLDLYSVWYCRALAYRAAPTLLRSAPMLVIAGLFLDLQPPASLQAAAAFLIAMTGALLLTCALTTLMHISLLWTLSGQGMSAIMPPAVTVFSGMVVPLPLFPLWAQTFINVLPFRGLVDTPYRLYMGHIPIGEMPIHLAHQAAWTAGLILLGRWALGKGLRRMTVQGG